MGLKMEVKARMRPGVHVILHIGVVEYEGVVEKNTLISGEHGSVESDSCCVIRNDEKKERYIIPLGYQTTFVLVVPFEEQDAGKGCEKTTDKDKEDKE